MSWQTAPNLLCDRRSASNALPPQAITEEAKSCKAISNDQQRLKCFDSLFADKPNQTKPSETSVKDNWSIEESKSPADGSAQVIAANLVGHTVLILRCKDQTTEAAFSTKYNYLGSRSVDVQLRINEEKPFKEVWKALIDGRAAFASDAVEFIRMLPDNAKLFVRTNRSDGKIKEANFNLGEVSDIRNKIAQNILVRLIDIRLAGLDRRRMDRVSVRIPNRPRQCQGRS
jgi:hypothetical protein